MYHNWVSWSRATGYGQVRFNKYGAINWLQSDLIPSPPDFKLIHVSVGEVMTRAEDGYVFCR